MNESQDGRASDVDLAQSAAVAGPSGQQEREQGGPESMLGDGLAEALRQATLKPALAMQPA